MSLYFPRPLYEPEEVSLSLTSTLTLQYNHVVNRSTETTEIPFETYYRPDTGGEEVTIEFDIPVKTPQTMDFKFPKGTMSMTHAMRVTMKTRLFPGDKSKCSTKIWSVDLPVTIKGRHYVSDPLSPALSTLTTVSSQKSPTSQATIRSLSHKASDTSQASRFASGEESDGEGTMPLSAVSATSSFATTTSYYSSAAETTSEPGSPRRSTVTPPAKRQKQKTVPPQKPAPTGPLPAPPQSATPSPVPLHRISPERQTRSAAGDRTQKEKPIELQQLYPRKSSRDLNNSYPEHNRSISVPPPKSLQPDSPYTNYDPFLPPSNRDREPVHYHEPQSASSVSTKSTYPLTPTDLPSYYHSKPTYYIDNTSKGRPRANTTGSATPTSPVRMLTSPPGSPQITRVKFNPEVSTSPSPPSVFSSPRSPTQLSPQSPSSAPRGEYPFPKIDTTRKGSASSEHGAKKVSSPTSPPASMLGRSGKRISPTETVRSDETVKAPSQYSGKAISPPPIKLTPPAQMSSSLPTTESHPHPLPTSPTLNSKLSVSALAPLKPPSTTTSTRRAPPLAINPVARPPLPSSNKTRITSMATTDTNITGNTSRATTRGTMSTTATSVSGGAAPRVQLKRRPTKPSLFPPLPPATMAVQRQRLGVGDMNNDRRQWI